MASSGEPKFRLHREHGLQGLRERGEEAVRSLLHLLGTPDARDRNTVREILVELDSLSLDPLVTVLEAGGPEPSWAGEGLAPAPPRDPVSLDGWRRRERRLVCDILGRMGRPEALPAVLSVLQDTSWTHRAAAAEAIGRIGVPETVTDVCALLDDPHPQVRVKAAWALGRIESESVAPCLVEALGDSYFGVRWVATVALARRPEGWEALRQRLAGGDEDLWIMALDAACEGGAPGDTATCVEAVGALLGMSPEALSRGGVSLFPTMSLLAGSPVLSKAVREEVLHWMQKLARQGITRPTQVSGPGSN
jgi:HEAT repeat protein